MNLLIVDDEFLEIEQLEYLIKPHFPNWHIYKAHDASQAMTLAKQHRIHLAFLDIQMPGKTGLELAKELQQLYELDIIMVTAYQSFDYAQQAIRVGVSDYLTKPIIEEELIQTLKKYDKWSSKNETIQAALSIIHERYAEKLTVNSIAAEVFVHPSYLSRKFLEVQQIGLNEYINNYRLEKAKASMLNNPKLSISEIAEQSGFNSQHYFSVAFKKKYGMAPREYKVMEVNHNNEA
ncbi:response regulator transcription factor [Metasolibacillus meyeri]|uniref:response regulator transcription factor n=1 Tax=Metasolibacillus meyeri TaxID=1071052 RepID=UPI000D3160A6|nr:response regulator [Metasolibacillus meyeri]